MCIDMRTKEMHGRGVNADMFSGSVGYRTTLEVTILHKYIGTNYVTQLCWKQLYYTTILEVTVLTVLRNHRK